MHDCGLTGEEAYILSKKYTDTHGSGGTAVQSDWEENDPTADDYIKNKPDLTTKADKVTGATNGNFAALNSSGNLVDSDKSADDFMFAFTPGEGLSVTEETDIETGETEHFVHNSGALNVKESATDGKITLTKATSYNTSEDTDIPIHGWSNKANTSDVTISSTATGASITLTDSADGYLQGVTVKGHSEVVDGAIKSVGDADWGVVDLGTLTWYYYSDYQAFAADLPTGALYNQNQPYNVFSGRYLCVLKSWEIISNYELTVGQAINHTNKPAVSIRDGNYTDATAFKSAMSGVLLYYPLADTTGATPTFGITSKDGAGQGTAATITTGLPLRSVSDTIFDTADNEKVVKKCGKVKGSDLTWQMISNRDNQFAAQISDKKTGVGSNSIICSDYVTSNPEAQADKSIWAEYAYHNNDIVIHDSSYSDATTFAAAIADMEIVYPLATPTETPLTSAEKSALAQLRTYDSTTHIDATDEPSMTVDYLLNTTNGQAASKVDKRGRATSTVLYNDRNLATRAAVSVSYELAESYADFDEIKLEYAYYVSGTAGAGRAYIYTFSFDVAEFEEIRTKQFNDRTGRIMLATLGGYISLYITDTTHLLAEEVNNASGSHYQYITQITGIKHL